MPPSATSTSSGGNHGAGLISPSSSSHHHQQPTSPGSRFGGLSLGFRRNRGNTLSRMDVTNSSSANSTGPPSPPNPPGANVHPAFPALQASTSLNSSDLPPSPGIVSGSSPGGINQGNYFGDGSGGEAATTPSYLSQSTSSTRNLLRRGFGRKTTAGTGSGRTPTSEVPPPLLRSRSSSQPSLPLNHPSNNNNSSTSTSNSNSRSGSAHGLDPPHTGPPSSSNNNTTSTHHALSSSMSAATGSFFPPQSSPLIGRAGSGSGTGASPSQETTDPLAAVPESSTMVLNAAPSSAQPAARRQTPTSGAEANPASGSGGGATTAATSSSAAPAANAPAPASASGSASTSTGAAPAATHHIRLVPHLESTRSLTFDPVSRDAAPTVPLRIGRFTDRNPNQPVSCIDQSRIAFKSKVVSRTHAEIWYDAGTGTGSGTSAGTGTGTGAGWFIRDLKSSSGTFLNHIRLSGAGMESRPFPLRDGDVLQLGVDYQGGQEDIYRCVKMRVELNRGWQRGVNSFK